MSRKQPTKRRAHVPSSGKKPEPRAGQHTKQQAPRASEADSTPRARPPRFGESGGQSSSLVVVGIGASAGGLEPLQELLQQVPAKSGLVFVVVQHLKPHHTSMLAELLSRHTAMPVVQAADGIRAEPDHVYVISPGTLLTLTKAVLQVAATDTTPVSPIDAFFHSLAEDQGDHAVGVLLSGAGHDGTVGLRMIKEHGGLTLAQPPDTAKHDSMLQSAIGAGLVDHVVPVEQMSAKLTEHAEHLAKLAGAHAAVKLDEQLATHLGKICSLIHQRTGHDFSRYKDGTLLRRIGRRLQVRHLDSVEDYLQLLEKDAAEAEGLLKDLLIGVTQFFRDPDAFQALAQEIIPRIVQGKAAATPIRIWVPGCASGEEAYSIAILLREHLDRLETRRFVQIFATDLEAEMLADARHGRYPARIAEHVLPERLARFFVREGQTYQAVEELREMCIFSQHSLIRDPPFSQLDLISCRNVLIYLSAALQNRLVPLFHYALRPGGFLFLGPSEGIAGSPELFEAADKRNRIFRRKETITRPMVEFPLSGRSAMRAPPGSATAPTAREPAASSAREKISAAFERALRDDYTCPSAVINERGDVLFIAGPISRYLQLSAGAMTMPNLLESFRGSLRHELRLALRIAKSGRPKVVRTDISVEVEDATRKVRLVVRPMPASAPEVGLFLVVVQEALHDEATGDVEVVAGQQAVEQLEDELRTTRAELKTTVEELESANEELKSSNEELISTNEELQSANEEMQTSKEELQSLNEELETVNTELRQKVDELGAANSDLQNLFAATEIATIFLDRSLRVAKFTPAATMLFHLIEVDVGRPLADFAQRFAGQNLVSDAQDVLRLLTPIERQVRTAEGAWFVLRVVPYRTVDNLIAGVVVTFVDVTELKHAEEEVRRQGQLVHLSHDAILIWRLDGGIESWNRGAQELYGFSREEALGQVSQQLLQSRFPRPWSEIEAELLAGGCWAGDIQQRTNEGRTIIVSCNLQLVRGDDGVARVLEANRDITERKRAEEALRQTSERERFLAEVIENATTPFGVGAPDGSLVLFNRAFADLTGYSREELEQRRLTWATDLTPPEWREREAQLLAQASRTGETVRYEKEYLRKDGSRVPIELSVQPVLDRNGGVTHYRSFLADITERRQAEAKQAWLSSFPERNPTPITEIDAAGQITYANRSARELFPDLFERGLAHPWLAGLGDLTRSTATPGAPVQARLVRVGETTYQQAVFYLAESGRYRAYGMDVTERERAVDELNRLTQQRQLALDAARMGWWHYDPMTKIAAYDDRYQEIFGVSGHERANEEILKLLHPEDLPRVLAAVEAALDPANPKPYAAEYRVKRPDGTECWVVAHGLATCEGEGAARRTTSLVGTVADITTRKRAEAALVEAHGRTTAILESIADAFYSLDAEWRFTAVNPAAERAPLGRPASELLGKVIWDVFPAIRDAQIHQHYLDAVEKRSREHYEVQSPLNGRWYEVFMFPRTGGLDVYLRDIDDRKKAEEAVKASEERFRTLAGNAQDSIARFDRRGRYVYANPFAARLLGIPEEAILGKTVEELGRNIGTENFEERLREVFDSGKSLRFDRRSTEGRWFDVQLIPEFRDSTVETVLSCARDITERKAAEAALRASDERLKLAQQIAHLGSWELDLVERRLSWSDEVYRIFGLEPRAFSATYEAFLDAVHPEDRAAVDAAYSGSLHDGRDSYEIEHRVVRKGSGEVRIVHEKCEHVRDASGRIIRSVGMVQDISERRRAEEQLREREQRLRLATTAANLGVFEWDVPSDIARWDDRMFEIFGRTRAEGPIGRHAFYAEALEPEDRLMFDRALAEAARPDALLRVACRIRRRCDHQQRWIQYAARLDLAPDGSPERMIGVLEDITERKNADIALQATTQRFYAVLSTMYSAVLLVTSEGRVEFANQAFCDCFGLDDAPAGLAGLSAGDMIARIRDSYAHPDEAIARIHEIVDRGIPVKGEEVAMRGGATMLRNFVPLELGGASHGRLWVHIDISERKRAEETLRESESRFRHLADAMPQLVWTAEPDGTVDYLNRRHETLSGASRGDDGTWTWSPVIHPDDVQATLADWDHAVRTGQNYEVEQRLMLADGAFRWHLARATPIRDESGRILKWYGTTTDIHQMKEAQRALQDADRSKNEFLAVLSHELRNPLTPIRNSLYVLERAVPGGEQAKRAQEVIGRQSDQLARLVDDLLDVTRISRNKIQLQKGPLELNDLVRRTVEDYRSLFEGKSIAVEATFAAERLPINGDAARLAQMVGNLLQNAAKFTPAGGRLMVSTAAATARGRATLRVVDTGVGIEPAMLRRLFQPFIQAEATLDRSKGGLGLGLALVKGLVEMHGGEICAHSDGPGKGAEFVVELPLDVAAAHESSPTAARTAGRRRRVLIIEDNIDAADSLREVLKFGEHVIEVAYDGPGGLVKAREFKPEVVLCDIGLPGMNGFEVARAFRADDSFKGIVLVALSGYALSDDLQRAQDAGFDHHLAKPPSLERLEGLLAGALPSKAAGFP